MSHGPSEQYTNQHGLQLLTAKEFNLWLCPVHINLDLLEVLSLILGHIFDHTCQVLHCLVDCRLAEIVLHDSDVFFTFALESVLLDLLVDRYVVTQETPDNTTYMRDTCHKSQRFEIREILARGKAGMTYMKGCTTK